MDQAHPRPTRGPRDAHVGARTWDAMTTASLLRAGVAGSITVWTGEIDLQPKTFPRLFELAPGVVASLGYSGRGVPTGTMMGTVLRDWAMGMRREDLTLPLEPLKAAPLYMKVVPRMFLAATRWQDQRVARREGVNPPPY